MFPYNWWKSWENGHFFEKKSGKTWKSQEIFMMFSDTQEKLMDFIIISLHTVLGFPS